MTSSSSRIAAAAARRFGAALEPSGLPHLDALAALNERSVCRRYRPDPVPEAVLALLCATALSAPRSCPSAPAGDVPDLSYPAQRPRRLRR
jgi:hypothetical protein